jgi:hypothetical protein
LHNLFQNRAARHDASERTRLIDDGDVVILAKRNGRQFV